jgi:hypothetical protein
VVLIWLGDSHDGGVPGRQEPLVSDFPKDLPVSYEKIRETEARVIPPGVLAPGQPGSVTLVRDGVFITLFGWLPDLSTEDLRSIAARVVAAQAATG